MRNNLLWTAVAVITIIAVALSACIKDPAGATPTPPSTPPTTATKPVTDTMPRAVALELEKRVEAERSVRLQTETKLEKKEAEKSHWQSAALLMTSAAIVLLIVGTILGSKARHETEK